MLVEPAEGLCSQEEWQRAYADINDFEDHLTRHGILVIKLWLAITKDEQLRRFSSPTIAAAGAPYFLCPPAP